MSETRLVLASQSTGRLSTLQGAGVDPLVVVSSVDEDEVTAALPPSVTPADLVCALAEAKAQSVAKMMSSTKLEPRRYLVLGCDSMLEIGGRMVGKPHTPEVAKQRIQEMRERDGVLWTGHSLVVLELIAGRWTTQPPLTEAASTIVHFGQISDAEIDAYVATGEPLEVAGSFTIDGLGGPFLRGVTGDPHAVVGVSLPLLRDLTQRTGTFWPDLWAQRSKGAPAA